MIWSALAASPAHGAVLEYRLADDVAGLARPGRYSDRHLKDTSAGIRRSIGTRVSVIGASGSGKSHVSRILGELLDLPVFALDDLRDCVPGGSLHIREFTRQTEILVSRDTWVIDGHYVAIRHLIWQRSDTIIYLNYPLYMIFAQLVQRYMERKLGRLRHASRSDVPARKDAGVNQRWQRLLKTFRERQDFALTLRSPEYERTNVIELTSREAVREWLESLRTEG